MRDVVTRSMMVFVFLSTFTISIRRASHVPAGVCWKLLLRSCFQQDPIPVVEVDPQGQELLLQTYITTWLYRLLGLLGGEPEDVRPGAPSHSLSANRSAVYSWVKEAKLVISS